jgi:hypothetical protein
VVAVSVFPTMGSPTIVGSAEARGSSWPGADADLLAAVEFVAKTGSTSNVRTSMWWRRIRLLSARRSYSLPLF